MSVRLAKEGYLPYEANQTGFEYAGFWEETFHEPDPNNPVIFRLHKKTEGVPLLHREDRIEAASGQRLTVPIESQTRLGITLIENGQIREKKWSAQLEMTGGGIQPSTDEFPFEAPEDGYQSVLTIDIQNPKPVNWGGLYQGGLFYFKTSDGRYGRIELKTVSGKNFMRYSFFLNPTPGERNLQHRPKPIGER